MRASDWSRPILLRSDWSGPSVALCTTYRTIRKTSNLSFNVFSKYFSGMPQFLDEILLNYNHRELRQELFGL